MNIKEWLDKFKNSREDKNINNVLSLFSSSLVYYENPFYKLTNLDDVKIEWNAILNQNDINLDYDIFSKEENKYTVQWNLEYSNDKWKKFHFSGIYLIILNEEGLCCDFRHYCEQKLNQPI